jgi:hypothetical protein
MNCQDVKARLQHPDCAADEIPSPEIQAHVRDCAECRRLRDRLAAILDPGSALPREIQSSRDLWPGIASRLDETNEGKVRRIRSIPAFFPLAAAAGIAAVVVISQLVAPSGRESTDATAPIPALAITEMPAPALLPVTTVEMGFTQTRVVLLKLVEVRKAALPSEQVAALEHTLSTMDSAVRDLHAALELDPYNPSLLFKLSYTRRSEIRVLQQAIL